MRKIKQGDYVSIDWNLINGLNNLGITNGKEIMLFAKIISLSNNEDKACTATNDYLSSFFCTTDRNIRKYLQDLKDKRLIKVFEQKEGLRTTKRYIYPQYEKLSEEETFLCSDEGAEHLGKSTGTKRSNERNIHSEPAEQTDLLIIEDKRKEKNIIDNGADAPNKANASESSEEKHKLIKIFRKENIDKIQVYGYEKVFIGNSKFNKILNDLMYALDDNTMLEGYISAAKEQGIGRDYTCSYVQEYIYDMTEEKS